MQHGGPELLEREREIGEIAVAIEAAARGTSKVLVFEGPGGIGKSRLIGVARDCARSAGMEVLSARGSELETGFPFGVVRQLFEPLLFRDAGERREEWFAGAAGMARWLFEDAPDSPPALDQDRFSLLHALYWLCANVALERPLALIVDDAHWADAASLDCLSFVVRRLEMLPLVVAVATRPAERSSPPSLTSLIADGNAQVLRVAPLTAGAVEAWVREALGDGAAPEFAQACHRVTHGNPLLMRELMLEVEAQQLPPAADQVERVLTLGPRGVATIVLVRLSRLAPEATQLARALTVLGGGAKLADAAELARLDEREATTAAHALEAAEILGRGTDELQFAHPIVRAAIYEDLSALERSRMHAAAARLRAGEDGSAEEVASHLLVTAPAGDPWVVSSLRSAARSAVALGDPRTAVACLTRALNEPPSPAERPAVLAELGSAEASTGDQDYEVHMRDAIATSQDATLRVATAIELGNLLKFSARPTAAVDAMSAVEDLEPADRELAERLRVEMLATAFTSAAAYERVADQLAQLRDPGHAPQTFLEAFTLAAMAFMDVCERAPYQRVAERAKRALESGLLPADPTRGGQIFVVATVALIWADELEYVDGIYAAAREDARRRGSAITTASLATMSAMADYKRGDLLAAESHAQAALSLAGEIVGTQVLSPVIGAYGAMIGLERSTAPAKLMALLDDPAIRHDMDNLPYSQVLPARGMLREAGGDLEGALEDFLACDRPVPVWGGQNPTMIPWRGRAALVLKRLRDEAEAQRLTDEEVSLAREYGAPRPLGIALHNAALVRDEPERGDLLLEALEVLEGSSARMDLAEAYVNLGAALRARSDKARARERLREGLELAVACGATRIAEQARQELGALGVRPRREALHGVEALTAAERRVADLAASGLTNRDIAQALFVTEKTVETHLGHIYDKLGVRSRYKLPEALGRAAAA